MWAPPSFQLLEATPHLYPWLLQLAGSSTMPGTSTTRLLGYRWSELFDLVLDVKSYPEFVPHCRAVRMVSREVQEPGRTVIVSRMTVGFLRFEIDYANRTTGDEIGHRISVEAIDGPIRYLRVGWNFEPVGEDHTKLHFSVNYEFNNPVLRVVASQAFNAMFGQILNAFERRAACLFPKRAAAVGAGRRGSERL